MNNVLTETVSYCLKHDMKTIVDELSNLDSIELTNNIATIINTLFDNDSIMKVDSEGNAKIRITLTAEQIKMLLIAISKQI